MSEYTTGELAKLTNISVRTIQFYDKRNLLKPSKISESGKRYYTDKDLSRLKLILFLKNIGLSLKVISEILESQNSMQVLNLLLEQQTKLLRDQLSDSKKQLKRIEEIRHNLPEINQGSLKSIDDIDKIMENKKSLRRVHLKMIVYGLLMDAVEIGTLVWGIRRGQWIPFVFAICLAIVVAIWISKFYFSKTNYICPNCNSEFKTSFKAAFWAGHNPKARKLTCPVCGQTNYCVEVYDDGNAIA